MENTEPASVWIPDVLPGFEQRPLDLPGGESATLVRRRAATRPAKPSEPSSSGQPADLTGQDQSADAVPPAALPTASSAERRPAVLYLHGFVDYFFQVHLAEAFEARGYRFYAVELRGYGRSIERSLDPGRPNFVPEIAAYAEDLDAAARAIAEEEGHSELVGLGHSTGGLIMPLWAAKRPGRLRALVLNSPWLDFNANWFMRVPFTQLLRLLAKVAPMLPISGIKIHYGRALHCDTGGEWDYDLRWKPHDGFPTYPVWFSSIRRWQARVAKGLDLECPVLVMTSLRRGDPVHHHPELVTTDSVLNPAQMWRLAPKLGADVEVRALEGGAHDLSLSPEPTRTRFLTETLDWLDRAA
ncbi:MAG: alpha/beta fold hydrolase [Bifidobacteriaceae bacterium]|jgi:alpha-beta hydrolase superfamily lysophospholipase|nr:alpha/beta fold hydrolase [Bifidobacteriaceae bacterium]